MRWRIAVGGRIRVMHAVFRAKSRAVHESHLVLALALGAGLALCHGRACAQDEPGGTGVNAAVATERADAAEPGAVDGTGRTPPTPAPAAEESEGLFRGVRPELGPVRWGGSLGQQYDWQRSSDPGRSRGRIDLLNLAATSYVWQPWFAQLRAGLGVLRSTTHAAGGTPPDTTSSSSDSTNLTGDLGVSLFPVSRFPFDAYVNVSDSRASNELTSDDFRNRRLGMRQAYRTADDRTRYTARYDQSELTSARFGRDALDVFEAGMSRRDGEHSFELNGGASSNRGGVDGTDSDTKKASGRHTYSAGSNLSVESLASYNENVLTSGNASSAASASSRVKQVTSFGTWRPDDGDPLYRDGRPLVVTASARLFSIESETSSSAAETHTGNATVGASYAVSRHTRAGANASATQTSSGGAATRLTSQNANLTYTPDSLRLGEFAYAWNLSGTASNATASRQGARQTAAVQAAHNVTRSYELAPGARVAAVAGQGAGVSHDESGNAPSLTHSAGLTWSSAGASGSMTYVSLNASDTRAYRPAHTSFQMVNLQATRQHPLTAVSYWSGNFTVQGTRQRSEHADSDFEWTSTGGLTYRHQRAFDVPRLRFTAIYSAASQQLASRAGGDVDAPREFTSQSAEARLEYNIGKLELRLSARTAWVEERRDSLLFFRVLRQL